MAQAHAHHHVPQLNPNLCIDPPPAPPCPPSTQVCVRKMAEAHAHVTQLSYVKADARSMPEFEDASLAGGLLGQGGRAGT